MNRNAVTRTPSCLTLPSPAGFLFAVLILAKIAISVFAPVTRAQPLPTTNAAVAVLQVPPLPDDLDLSSVEKLYKSSAYRVDVRRAGSEDPATVGGFMKCFVFETRNDWVLRDFFGKHGPDPMRVLRGADELGEEKGFMRTASFTQCSFSNTAIDVRVTLLRPDATARTVTVRPLRHAIAVQIAPDGRSFSFRLERPLKVSIEVNDRLDPLFLFADSPDVPDLAATHYFGPGVHRLPGDGRMTLNSGDRVYIAAGAIVEGRFNLTQGSHGVTIRGRGILSTGEWPHLTTDVPWLMRNATFYSSGTDHFLLEGLTLVQGSAWTVAIDDDSGHDTHDNVYQNVKMVHWAGNTDGFWITGRRNRIDDCFEFINDDAVVSKGGGDCVVSNLVFWGGAWGRLTLLFNFGRPIENITIQNVDVIGKGETPRFIIAERLRRSPPTEVRNITFRNVRFEERAAPTPNRPGSLLGLDAGKTLIKFSHLRFENLTLDQQFPDEGGVTGTAALPASDITFTNLRMAGRPIGSAAEGHFHFNEFVTGVRFETGAGPESGSAPAR